MTAAYYTGGIGMKGLGAYMAFAEGNPELGIFSAGLGLVCDAAGYATSYLMNNADDRIIERFEKIERERNVGSL